jgi:hypothetical protein
LIKGQVLLRFQNSVQRFNFAVQSNVSNNHFPLFPPFHLLFAFSTVLPRIVFRLVKFSAAPTLCIAHPVLPRVTTSLPCAMECSSACLFCQSERSNVEASPNLVGRNANFLQRKQCVRTRRNTGARCVSLRLPVSVHRKCTPLSALLSVMDLFVYWLECKVLVFRECKFAVPPDGLKTHLRRAHKDDHLDLCLFLNLV